MYEQNGWSDEIIDGYFNEMAHEHFYLKKIKLKIRILVSRSCIEVSTFYGTSETQVINALMGTKMNFLRDIFVINNETGESLNVIEHIKKYMVLKTCNSFILSIPYDYVGDDLEIFLKKNKNIVAKECIDEIHLSRSGRYLLDAENGKFTIKSEQYSLGYQEPKYKVSNNLNITLIISEGGQDNQ